MARSSTHVVHEHERCLWHALRLQAYPDEVKDDVREEYARQHQVWDELGTARAEDRRRREPWEYVQVHHVVVALGAVRRLGRQALEEGQVAAAEATRTAAHAHFAAAAHVRTDGSDR